MAVRSRFSTSAVIDTEFLVLEGALAYTPTKSPPRYYFFIVRLDAPRNIHAAVHSISGAGRSAEKKCGAEQNSLVLL
jgi:hypothetical protein